MPASDHLKAKKKKGGTGKRTTEVEQYRGVALKSHGEHGSRRGRGGSTEQYRIEMLTVSNRGEKQIVSEILPLSDEENKG